MKNFEIMKNDPYILGIYEKIGELESTDKQRLKESGGMKHNVTHIAKVIKLADQISNVLGVDEQNKEEILISALLHDIGAVQGRGSHALDGSIMAQEYLENFDIAPEVKSRIVESIAGHSKGSNTLQGKVLALADKLHITNDRLYDETKEKEHGKHFQNLNDVNVSVDNDTLLINFDSNGNFDIDGINKIEWVIAKVFEQIKQCAEFLGLKWKVFVDGQEWEITSEMLVKGREQLNKFKQVHFEKQDPPPTETDFADSKIVMPEK